jgi:hypothetical protein
MIYQEIEIFKRRFFFKRADWSSWTRSIVSNKWKVYDCFV